MSKFVTMECCCCGNRNAKSFRQYDGGYICGCCGVAFRIDEDDKTKSDEMIRLERGYSNLRNYEFQKARYAFMDVLADYPKSVDARWGLLLSKYGVVFIKGFFDGVVEPIYCFPEYDELNNKMFRGEKEYGEILELIEGDEELVDFYEKKSRKIDAAIRKFRECKNDIERDVFLCVKISAATECDPEAPGRTEDYEFAQKVYKDLRARGLNVFFSFVTLHNEVQSDHEIWLNLVKSKKMLLIGSREEYVESAWVKSEWKRWFFLERHDEMYICSMKHDYQNPKSILPHELRTTQIYTLDTYDKLISDISGETAAEEERARLEAEERARKAEELRKQAEIEDRLRWEEEMKAQFQAQIKAQAEAMERMKAEMEARAKAEAEARAKAEAEAKAKAEAEARAKAEAEARAKAEAEARAKAEAEAKAKAEAEAKAKAEAEARAKAEAEAKAKAEAEARAKAEAEARAKAAAEAQSPTGKDGKIVYKDGGTEVLKCGITEIPSNAYYGNNNIISIVIPDGVKKIGDSAFDGCESLESITIPDGVEYIGEQAFSGCTSIKEIRVPDSVTDIGNFAFGLCQSLVSVTLPKKLETIRKELFTDCYALENVSIPESVTVIESGAFHMCQELAGINIPVGVRSIGAEAFECCPIDNVYYGGTKEQWQKISIGESNEPLKKATVHFADESRVSVNPYTVKDGKIVYKNGKTEVMADSIVRIASSRFIGKNDIVSIILPDGIKAIGDNAFALCNNLTSVAIPNSVTEVGSAAFNGCQRLKDIVLPEGIEKINSKTFNKCLSLTKINIPKSVKSISYGAFANCKNLAEVFYSGTKEEWKEISIAKDNDALAGATVHCDGGDIVPVQTAEESIPNRDGEVIYKTGKVDVLRYGIKSISAKAYYNNKDIIKVVLPGSVRTIEGGSPYSITAGSLFAGAFYGCSSLINITIPEGVTTIGKGAFSLCSILTNLELPSSITTIESGAFSCCYGLKEIKMPEKITEISEGLFSGCHNLASVTIPQNVTVIGARAFMGCDSLKDIYYGGSKADWAKIKIGKDNPKLNGLIGKAKIHYGK